MSKYGFRAGYFCCSFSKERVSGVMFARLCDRSLIIHQLNFATSFEINFLPQAKKFIFIHFIKHKRQKITNDQRLAIEQRYATANIQSASLFFFLKLNFFKVAVQFCRFSRKFSHIRILKVCRSSEVIL